MKFVAGENGRNPEINLPRLRFVHPHGVTETRTRDPSSASLASNFDLYIYIYIYISSECTAQGQVLQSKRRNLGCNSAEGRSSTPKSGAKAAVLPGIE